LRAAPAVEVQIRRGGGWLLLVALLSGVAAAAMTAWIVQQAAFPHAAAAAGTTFVAAAALAWRFTPIDAGTLGWDGQDWRFAGQSGDVRTVCDLGPWLLLRFEAADTGRLAWLAASERSAGAAWTALRAAVYSRRSNRDDSDRENASATRT